MHTCSSVGEKSCRSYLRSADNVTDAPGVTDELPLGGKTPRRLADAEFDLFCAIGAPREVAAGETIFRKGEHGRSMFVIESGRIDLEFGDGMPRKNLGPREFLGELALFIGNHSRVASAVAIEPSRLRIIDHIVFEDVLRKEPLLFAQFMRRSFAYLVASEQQLISYLKRRNEDLISTLHSLRQTQTQLSTANSLVCTDELTGLTNRRGLYKFLQGLPTYRTAGTSLALFLIDVDRFKQINDEFGHLVGDHALCLVARELRRCIEPTDLCCRLGGDEFAVLVQIPRKEDLGIRAAEIVAAVRSALVAAAPRCAVDFGQRWRQPVRRRRCLVAMVQPRRSRPVRRQEQRRRRLAPGFLARSGQSAQFRAQLPCGVELIAVGGGLSRQPVSLRRFGHEYERGSERTACTTEGSGHGGARAAHARYLRSGREYTRLVEQLGDQRAAELMRHHDRLARDLLHRHGGQEIDKTDGFLLLFERPIRAVAFALDYQRRLQAFSRKESVPLRSRIGIHVGDVMLWDNDADDIAQWRQASRTSLKVWSSRSPRA